MPKSSQAASAKLYLSRQASSFWRYLLEQTLMALLGWIPTLLGIGLRALCYKLMMRTDGFAAIENGVRLRFASNIHLGRGVYLDQGVYLHAGPRSQSGAGLRSRSGAGLRSQLGDGPRGIEIGEGTLVMANAILHVYNFRNLPHSGIVIGRNALIGEANVIRGQGGVTIGDNVYTAPLVQILAVEHVYDDPSRPIKDQGITAEGIVIEDDAWIGAGAIITDGVRIGKGSVVGAGAVVTRDVPPHSVVVGVPARVVKEITGAPQGAARVRQVYF